MLTLLDTITGHTDRVWCAAWSNDGQFLATCSSDKMIKIHKYDANTNKWRCKQTLDAQHSRTVRSVSWSPNGELLACASFDRSTSIWRRSSEQEDFHFVNFLEGHESEVKCVSWDSSGDLLATCGRDKSVWVWLEEDDDFDCVGVLNGHSQDVKRVLWHPNRPLLLSASYDDTVRCWCEELDDWVCVDTLRGHTSTVWDICFNPTGTHVASCSDDLNIIIWRLEDQSIATTGKTLEFREETRISGEHGRSIYSVSWSKHAEKDLIASACGDDCLRIFGRNKQGEQFALLHKQDKAHETDLNCVAWNPVHTNLLATTSDDHNIKIWKFE
ncbi:CIAO1 [Acrasis kona]|uniref:Probable cytosolic iron-sulfur protein assembly protein CIAO1 homolog n=1 Tax=Acrasis kona TaxID=1008807 RepID=A0AAW2YLR6_9EUKA